MGDGVNNNPVRVQNGLPGIPPRRDNGRAVGNGASVTQDAWVRQAEPTDVEELHAIIAELRARVAALEAKVSDMYDEETYAPVPLGQLAGNRPAIANAAPPANNVAPPANNAAPAADNGRPAGNARPTISIRVAPAPANNAAPAANATPANVGDGAGSVAALPNLPALNGRVRRAEPAPAPAPAPAVGDQAVLEPVNMYAVRSGDTLWGIAERQLGDPLRYPEIIRANQDKYPSLVANPDLIQPGWELVLPTGGRAAAPAPTAEPAPRPTNNRRSRPRPQPAVDEPVRTPEPEAAPEPRRTRQRNTGRQRAPEAPAAEPRVIEPEVLPPENAVTTTRGRRRDAQPVQTGNPNAPVPIDMTGVTIDPLRDMTITGQSTKVTGVGTETDTHWEVGPDGKATPTDQKTRITDADTRTRTRWESRDGAGTARATDAAPADATPAANATGSGAVEPAKNGAAAAGTTRAADAGALTSASTDASAVAPVPIDMRGIKIDPLKDFVIESQSTRVEGVDTLTDTHWEVGPDGKALPTDQKTQITAADTVTRTRWVARGGGTPATPTTPAVPAPAGPPQISEADAIKFLRGHIGPDGRISRAEIEAMPAGPGRDALLAHFDALLFGFIDPGREGWVDLHAGDLEKLEQALAQGRSVAQLAGELTSWVHENRKPGDLNKDGKLDEGDVKLYAAQLRAGTPQSPAPKPPASGDERLQQELEAFMRDHKDADDVVHLLKNSRQHVERATIEQKARLVRRAFDETFTDAEERNAAYEVLAIADAKGEFVPVLTYIDRDKNKLKRMFEKLAGEEAGAKLVGLLRKHDMYKNAGVVNAMDDDAVSDYVKALGWRHPMIGTNDELKALPDDVKRAFINKILKNQNHTLSQHRQAEWINQHLDLPMRLPAYDPDPRR